VEDDVLEAAGKCFAWRASTSSDMSGLKDAQKVTIGVYYEKS